MGWLLIIEWIKKGYGRGEGRWCGWRRRNTNGDVKNDAGDDVKNDAGDDAKNDAGDDAGDDTGAEKQVFPAAVPTEADTGVAIRYGIDNHAIILLIRKEKRWIFFENIRYFTLSLLSEWNATIRQS